MSISKAKKYYVMSIGSLERDERRPVGVYSSPAEAFRAMRERIESKTGEKYHRTMPEIYTVNKRTGNYEYDFCAEGIFCAELRKVAGVSVYFDGPSIDPESCDTSRWVVSVEGFGLNC